MYSAFNLKLVAEDRRFFGEEAITNFQSTFDAEKKELIRKAELHIEQNGVPLISQRLWFSTITRDIIDDSHYKHYCLPFWQ